MKKIGLVGGMSWRSTLLFYKYINEFVEKNNGFLSSAKIILSSINFSDLEALQRSGKWKEAEVLIEKEVLELLRCGADFIGICSGTGNECVERIKNRTHAPIVHIADSIGEYMKKNKISRVAMIGTIHTMEGDYIKKILYGKYGVEVFVPNKNDRLFINSVIYKELCSGVINKESKKRYISIINKLTKTKELEAVVLGCTEVPLLIRQKDVKIKLIDSTQIYAEDLARKAI